MSEPGSSLVTFRRVPAALGRAAVQRFASTVGRRVARGRAFHCRITGDAEIRRLNARFRGKDYPTDVLSFPSAGGDYLGDIAISFARARAQAAEFGHSVERELEILLLHGVLHLLGYDHEADAGRMRRAEARWRKELGLPAALIERTLLKKSGDAPGSVRKPSPLPARAGASPGFFPPSAGGGPS